MDNWLDQVMAIEQLSLTAPVIINGDDGRMVGLTMIFFGEIANDEPIALHKSPMYEDEIIIEIMSRIFDESRPML